MVSDPDLLSDNWQPDEVLRRDARGTHLRAILDIIRQRQSHVRSELEKGLAPQDFKRGQAALSCFDAAFIGLEKAWQKHHLES